MDKQYTSRHPLAWGIIAAVALFSAVAVGSIKGWLPIGDNGFALQACSECAIVESVRTVETPMAPEEPASAGTGTPAEGGAGASAAADTADAGVPAELPAVATELAYSFETTVRFEDGSTSVFSQAEPPRWQAGDKVRVVDGVIQLAS